MPSVAEIRTTRPIAGLTPNCVGHSRSDPCNCFGKIVAGEAIPAGTEVIIKDGKLYARPATPLEEMTKQRDEALVALRERNERVETLAERLALAEKARDSYSRQLSDLIRQNRALQERINNA